MNELFPIIGGFLAEWFAPVAPRRARVALAIIGGCIIALAATLGSGEYQISWSYLLLDVLLVAAGEVSGMFIRSAVREFVARGLIQPRRLPSPY
jgi:hypothetical protein